MGFKVKFNVKAYYIFLLFGVCYFLFYCNYSNARKSPVVSPAHESYSDYFVEPGPFARFYPPEEINQKAREFFNEKGITVELFKSGDKTRICPVFENNKFDVKKCARGGDYSVIAIFPSQPDGPAELEKFVFKTPFNGRGLANFKRVFYAQSINRHLRSLRVTSMRAPQKYLVLLPDGDQDGSVDENYKVMSEKISFSITHGNPFDLMTPEDLEILLHEVVFRFGLCDLHVDSTDRNIVYSDKGVMIFIDTESFGDRMSTWLIGKGRYDDCYFFKTKQVLPEEHFIAQYLLTRENRGSLGYELGKKLARWIHILNMGLIYPYRYYNFDTQVPPPQKDSLLNNPDRDFSEAAFAEHRRVIRGGICTVMKNIKLCTQEIERMFPTIRGDSLDSLLPSGVNDFGPELGGTKRFDREDDGFMFAVVPIEEYLTITTRRKAGPMRVYIYGVTGAGQWRNDVKIGVPGLALTDLEGEFPLPHTPRLSSVETKKSTSSRRASPLTRISSPSASHSDNVSTTPARQEEDTEGSLLTLSPTGTPTPKTPDLQPPLDKLVSLQAALNQLRERLAKLSHKLTTLKQLVY